MFLLVLQLVVLSFLTWLITEKVPLAPEHKTAIRVFVLVCLIAYVAWRLGLTDIPVPNLGGR